MDDVWSLPKKSGLSTILTQPRQFVESFSYCSFSGKRVASGFESVIEVAGEGRWDSNSRNFPFDLTAMRGVRSATEHRKVRWFIHSEKFTQTGHIPVRSGGGGGYVCGMVAR
jgi:hypothetical protein